MLTSTDIEVNTLLSHTLKVYEYLKKSGRPDMATNVLALGSRVAQARLLMGGVVHSKVYCPKCHRQLRSGTEISFCKAVGECISCDHVRGDLR